MTEARITSFREFWPYYLEEHRHPLCRLFHFIGTSGFLAALIHGVITRPQPTLLALGMIVIANGMASRYIEPVRPARRLTLVTALAAMAIAPQAFIPGVIWAYGWAWIGHFKVENNRPATFDYPAWSLIGDFRMYGLMTLGHLWSGDSVREEES